MSPHPLPVPPTPLGRALAVLAVLAHGASGGGWLQGSKAVARYVASAHGLAGSTPLEAATIDSICECVYDMDAASKVPPSPPLLSDTRTLTRRQAGRHARTHARTHTHLWPSVPTVRHHCHCPLHIVKGAGGVADTGTGSSDLVTRVLMQNGVSAHRGWTRKNGSRGPVCAPFSLMFGA